jgi:hypothetical protein
MSGMSVFELIKTVLDEIYERIPDEAKDEKIKKEIKALMLAYSKLAEEGVPHDYADDVTRFAYVYKYVTSHANTVCQLVPRCPDLARLFDRPQVNITCIGGGPGSDFLGLLKYAIINEKAPHLRLNLFDREPTWNECWSDVDQKLKSQLLISNVFSTFDVTDPDTWKSIKSICLRIYSRWFTSCQRSILFEIRPNPSSRIC